MKLSTVFIGIAAAAGVAAATGTLRLEPAPTKDDCLGQLLDRATHIPGAIQAGTIDFTTSRAIKHAQAYYALCMVKAQQNASTLTFSLNRR